MDKQDKQAKREVDKAQESADLAELIKLPAFRRFIRTHTEVCGSFRPSYSGEDTHTAAFREGQRYSGMWILAHIKEHVPESLPELMGFLFSSK